MPGVNGKDEIRLPAVDADEHAPPPYDGTMSDPLASPSQSQALNAARVARLRTAGRRAADAEPAAPPSRPPARADVAALSRARRSS